MLNAFVKKAENLAIPVIILALGIVLLSLPFTPFAKALTSAPTLSVTVASTITLSVPVTSIGFPSLTPGSTVVTSSTSTVTTNNATGNNFSLNRNDNDTTLDLSTDATTNITDKTEWIPGAATTTAGNAATYSGTGLAFRVDIGPTHVCLEGPTWWGTDGSPLFAGIASSSASDKKIGNCNTYVSASQDLVIRYILDVPTTQKTGSYDGLVTYTSVVNP